MVPVHAMLQMFATLNDIWTYLIYILLPEGGHGIL